MIGAVSVIVALAVAIGPPLSPATNSAAHYLRDLLRQEGFA
jgi:hypothetical protein